jgi:hypothetical protein
LVFSPEKQDVRLFRHTGIGYERVQANEEGRLPIAELALKVALLDGWVRYWSRGKLVPLPEEIQEQAEQQAQLNVALKASVEVERKRATDLKRDRDEAERQTLAERQNRETAERQALAERQNRETAERQALAERQNRETAERRAEQLAAQLRALGIDPAA